jgi:hypothetical protein
VVGEGTVAWSRDGDGPTLRAFADGFLGDSLNDDCDEFGFARTEVEELRTPMLHRRHASARQTTLYPSPDRDQKAKVAKGVPQNVPYASSQYAPIWAFSLLRQSASVRARLWASD